MGNLNCVRQFGQKDVNDDMNDEDKVIGESSLALKCCFSRRKRSSAQYEAPYFSSIRIFDRGKSCKRSRDSKEEKESSNICPVCGDKNTITNGEQEELNKESDEIWKTKCLLQPPFKPLSTPGESLTDNEVILIKVCFIANISVLSKSSDNPNLLKIFFDLFSVELDLPETTYQYNIDRVFHVSVCRELRCKGKVL